MPILWT